MRKFLPFIAATLLAAPSFAQQMMVETSNENCVIELDALHRITFNGSDVNILQTNGTTFTAPMGEISRIYFGDFTAIDDVEITSNDLVTYVSADEIAVNCPAGEIINIYNINGSQIFQMRQQEDCGRISIAQLPKGIYLLQASGKTAKFIKR